MTIKVDWKAETARVQGGFEEIFGDADRYMGKLGLKLRDSVLRNVGLQGDQKVIGLTALAVLADLAGEAPPFFQATDVLMQVPFTGNQTIYEPIRQLICGAYRRAEPGSAEQQKYRRMITIAVPDNPPHEPVLDDLDRKRANGLLLERSAAEFADVSPTIGILRGAVCNEVLELYLMWAFGGGQEWPMAAIDSEIDYCSEIVRKMTGIS